MISPKPFNRPKPHRVSKERKHLNKKFYNSKAWKATRQAYLQEYQTKIYNECTKGYWTANGIRLSLSLHQQTVILSLPDLPCEICLKHFCVEAYDSIEMGKELDHIERVNPENALESNDWGDPFDFNNLQMLCPRHHAKKNNREK